MWSIESDIEKRWLVLVLRFSKKINCIVCRNFTPVSPAFPETTKLCVCGTPRIPTFRGWPVVCTRDTFGHTRPDMPRNIKTLFSIRSDMPFAGHVSLVANLTKKLRPEHAGLPLPISCLIDTPCIPNTTACNQHGTTCNTHCTAPRPHIVRVTKCGTTLYELIDIWCIDICVAKCSNRFVSKIICK